MNDMRRDYASQTSLDALRLLIHDLQTSIVGHSGKVMEVLLANVESRLDYKSNTHEKQTIG